MVGHFIVSNNRDIVTLNTNDSDMISMMPRRPMLAAVCNIGYHLFTQGSRLCKNDKWNSSVYSQRLK